ncbi:tRNA (guanosine(37)-N1)-methyltransferase TrmD [bacterium]|nr:tRNA (guanosine(37)-N1)-methyltransferase TrmD [bacterium]
MKITVLTLFPQWFEGPFGESILARAQQRGQVELVVRNFRDWATDRHNTVDDAPYGGGGGMLLKAEPISAALDEVAGAPGTEGRAYVVYTSPRGKTYDQARAREFASTDQDIVIICGHYEGLDERVIETRVDEEISLGDFVLTGGEIPALAIVDSIVRLLPGVLGCAEGAERDSFSDGLLEAPHYTRPEEFEGLRVPDILLSGHHARIEEWRREMAIDVTRLRRPDLYEAWKDKQKKAKD